jgi:hypothetical protein
LGTTLFLRWSKARQAAHRNLKLAPKLGPKLQTPDHAIRFGGRSTRSSPGRGHACLLGLCTSRRLASRLVAGLPSLRAIRARARCVDQIASQIHHLELSPAIKLLTEPCRHHFPIPPESILLRCQPLFNTDLRSQTTSLISLLIACSMIATLRF